METITLTDKNGKNILVEVEKINRDMYGNPRYAIHYSYGNIVRGIEEIYANSAEAIQFIKSRIGGKKMRNMPFVVFQSYNVEYDLKKLLD